jgi:hypothetical protein
LRVVLTISETDLISKEAQNTLEFLSDTRIALMDPPPLSVTDGRNLYFSTEIKRKRKSKLYRSTDTYCYDYLKNQLEYVAAPAPVAPKVQKSVGHANGCIHLFVGTKCRKSLDRRRKKS